MLRKLVTAGLVVKRCSNWTELLASRLGYEPQTQTVRLRDGWQLQVNGSIANSWGQFFEAAIADVYGIRQATPDLIIDVGANIGSFTCLAARLHPNAKVYAFEPQHDIANILRSNLQINGITEVDVIVSPVTRDGRTVQFWTQAGSGSSSICLSANSGATEMRSVTLDRIPFRQFQNAFVKLDCEGSEAEILEWLCDNADSLSPVVTVACEYHPWAPRPIAEAAALLTQSGWRVTTQERFAETYLFGFRQTGGVTGDKDKRI
jgi:FkbM family methyltransferase